jgi:CRISPR system Cascade subunit CasB
MSESYVITKRIIESLSNNLSSSKTKAVLAELRNSTSRPVPSGIVMELIISKLPHDKLRRDGRLDAEPQAILNALQIYGIHQQGKINLVDGNPAGINGNNKHITIQTITHGYQIQSWIAGQFDQKHFNSYEELLSYLQNWNENKPDKAGQYSNLGNTMGLYRNTLTDKKSFDRRFNAMITSNSYEHLIDCLRGLVKILKAKSNFLIDYGQLAQDLTTFQISKDGQQKIKLAWSQAYYADRGEKQNEK